MGESRELPVLHDALGFLRRPVVLNLSWPSSDGYGVLEVLAGLTRLVVQPSLHGRCIFGDTWCTITGAAACRHHQVSAGIVYNSVEAVGVHLLHTRAS